MLPGIANIPLGEESLWMRTTGLIHIWAHKSMWNKNIYCFSGLASNSRKKWNLACPIFRLETRGMQWVKRGPRQKLQPWSLLWGERKGSMWNQSSSKTWTHPLFSLQEKSKLVSIETDFEVWSLPLTRKRTVWIPNINMIEAESISKMGRNVLQYPHPKCKQLSLGHEGEQ